MTRDSIQSLLAMMQGAYPNFNPADKTVTINVWTMALEDYKEDEVFSAFKIYLRTNSSGFAPSPGQLIEEIYQFANQDELNENEAWDLVINTISDELQRNVGSGYSQLPDVIQNAIGGAESFSRLRWMDEEARAREKYAFAQCYKGELAKKRKTEKIPQYAKSLSGNRNLQIERKCEEGIYEPRKPIGVQA